MYVSDQVKSQKSENFQSCGAKKNSAGERESGFGIEDDGVTCRIKWNTPELHTTQPLDYLSHLYSQVTLITSTRYSGRPSRGGRTFITHPWRNRNRHRRTPRHQTRFMPVYSDLRLNIMHGAPPTPLASPYHTRGKRHSLTIVETQFPMKRKWMKRKWIKVQFPWKHG